MNDDRIALTPAEAEYVILAAYDFHRGVAGHDYGGSKRTREVNRRFDALLDSDPVRAREVSRLSYTPVEWNDHADVLKAAWKRVAQPRYNRVLAESYRRYTPGTKRTIATWVKIARKLGFIL